MTSSKRRGMGGSRFREEVPGGATWSHVLERHTTLRIVDVRGGANVSALFYNLEVPAERYNMPDTLKAQYTAYLTKGRVLLSDMGRVLCSVVEDTCGWHDTLCGLSNAAIVASRHGHKPYSRARNDFHRNAHDNLLVELGKWGLGKQDLVPNVNFFSKVVADEDGRLSFVADHSPAGAFVDLRAEMNVLVVLTAVAHPLDPSPVYAPRPVELVVSDGEPPAADDPCRLSRPEAARAFENTERYFL
jgi:urea carboxylase-associated protein 2